jgi:hypothetical protein
MGPCNFDPDTLSFAGDPVQQTACLVQPVGEWGKLGAPVPSVPDVFAKRVGRSSLLPGRAAVGKLLAGLGLTQALAAGLFAPVSRARDGDPFAPAARYFVIHDTSGPRLDWFPFDLDDNPRLNNLARFRCADGFEVAHAVVNRMGDIFVGHDFGVPWRATKLERAVNFGIDLKGLFLHVELVQPRSRAPGHGRNGAVAPWPGFTGAQYDRLALLYTIASVRAGEWLIPAFHAVIDAGIRGGHDDPQEFDLDSFAQSLGSLLDRLRADDGPENQTAVRATR